MNLKTGRKLSDNSLVLYKNKIDTELYKKNQKKRKVIDIFSSSVQKKSEQKNKNVN